MRLSEKEFDGIVKRSIRRLPAEIRQHLDNIVISVLQQPSRAILAELGLPPDETLLGVFQGVPLPERSVTQPPLYPDTIFLFQRPLEDICRTTEELVTQVEITVAHEVAHFLGFSEEQLADLGYG